MFTNKYLRSYYLKYLWCFVIGFLALILVDWVQLYIPKYLGQIINIVRGKLDSNLFSSIVWKMILVAFLMMIGRMIWRFFVFYAARKIDSNIRHDMFVKAEKLSQGYFHINSVGTLMDWFTNDLEEVSEYLGWGFIMMVDSIFLSMFVIFNMIKLDVYETHDGILSLITLVPIVLIIIWGLLVEKVMAKKWTERQKEFDRLYDFTRESLTGVRVIKAFVKERQEMHAFYKEAKRNQDANVNFARVSVIFDVIIEVLIEVMLIAITIFGAYRVYNGIYDAGNLVTFIGYVDSLIWPMIALGQIISMRSRAKASLKRITDFLNTDIDVKDSSDAVELANYSLYQDKYDDSKFIYYLSKNKDAKAYFYSENGFMVVKMDDLVEQNQFAGGYLYRLEPEDAKEVIFVENDFCSVRVKIANGYLYYQNEELEVRGKITFSHLTFTFPDDTKPVLNDINLTINPGEKIGIVGKIGAGKTTLVNLLLRIYNVPQGELFIDDKDIMDIKLKSLRNNVSYVMQDTFLFSDSIKNNIAFADNNISEDRIIKAAKFADVDSNIKEFKEGYETISGERGVTLSGGQKQRIAIARAFIKNSPVLILDDAVAAVDLKTEETILDNIFKERHNKTTIMIASRVSTVIKMDKIIVLKEGQVEAFDTPHNLEKISETFNKMVYLQQLEQEVNGGVS